MRALFFAAALITIGLIPSGSGVSTLAAIQQTPDPQITAKYAIGEVKSIDSSGKLITIKTEAGSTVMVLYTDRTTYKKLKPGETSLANATDVTVSDVGEGDRIMARGNVAEDRKSVSALQIIVMSKGDIAKKQEAERLEWRRRGVLGVIQALKPEAHEITIQSRTMAGNTSIIIPVSDKTEMKRYAPDSIKFADAKPSTFTELKVGDQLRALGERTPDGTHFNPEKVVTGSV